jgi:hypothetical protein
MEATGMSNASGFRAALETQTSQSWPLFKRDQIRYVKVRSKNEH